MKIILSILCTIISLILLAWLSIYILSYSKASHILKNPMDAQCIHLSNLEFRWAENIKKEYLFFRCNLDIMDFYSLVFFYDPLEKNVVDHLLVFQTYESVTETDYPKNCFIKKELVNNKQIIHEKCQVILEDSNLFPLELNTPVFSYAIN